MDVLFCPMVYDTRKDIGLVESSQISPAYHSDEISVKTKMKMGHQWNDSNSNLKYSEENPSYCHYVQQKLTRTGPRSKTVIHGEKQVTEGHGTASIIRNTCH
jgi:hypothetical protein